ncbi:2-hydroxyacid dehydrogenase [Pseudomonas sp. EL_65y_Pfl2_R95]|uniref:2-hydroxyacid dehydrogenase n=1 Tax=Pseudomonas sp. EL_65y_Pfl2_R95 TaxID=3088698 RepID=UPI0030D9E222
MRIVLCGNTFPDTTNALLRALPVEQGDEVIVWSGDSVDTLPADIDVLIPKMLRIDESIMAASKCRLVQQWGVGLEGVDIDAAEKLGISVAYVPASGGNADSVAEHAVLMILALLRQLATAQHNTRTGVLGAPSGRMLAGRTACLFGLGAIALPIATRLRAFGVRLVGLSREANADKIAKYQLHKFFTLDQKEECLRQTDILIMCARLTDETRGIIGAREIACLPSQALLINVARGGLVNEQAIVEALRTGRLGGAGLDVYWQEPINPTHALLQMDNVIATPHIAGITNDSLAEIAKGVAENINRLRVGMPLLNTVMQPRTP